MIELSLKEIENIEGRWIVYAYTPLCGTCQVSKKMLDIVFQIEKVDKIGMVNVNYISTLATKWGIESVPCLLIMNNGVIEEKVYAFQSVPYLLEKIRSVVHVAN